MSSIAPRIAGRLAKIALGACAFAIVALSGASAQYYQPPGYYGGPPPGYYGGPPPGYYRQPPGYYDDGYSRPRRARYGSVCVTSRGSCQFEGYRVGTVCKCHIPGFGPKRGVVR